MIVDHILNAAAYHSLSPRFAAGLEFLKNLDFDALQTGRNDIDGDNLFAMKQEYDSRPLELGKWEAHRKYADIQFIVEGEEQMGYAQLDSLTITQPYEADRDCVLFAGQGDFIRFRKSDFAIFLPQDAHMPAIAITTPSRVKKVVVKVLL